MTSALHNLRIVEMGTGAVVPLATEMLALMGAQVIKVETARNLDFARFGRYTRVKGVPGTGDERGPDESPFFCQMGSNKLSLRLDLTRPEGKALMGRVIAVSDILTDNFAAGTLQRLGFGYDDVRRIKPDLVVLSATPNGSTGPEADALGFADIFAALSGYGDMTGYPDEPPTEGRGPADMYNAVTVAFALLTAVWQQRRAGQGRFIDMSGREALACLLGDALQESAANGAHPTRQGNRDAYMAPHNCYPCQGQDQWISIAVATEDEWQALCGAMGQPELADDPRFRDAPSRCANVEALDPIVGAWTAQREPHEAMNLLQAVGVAAVPAFSAEGLFADPHVVEREAFQTVSHPKLGDVFIVGSPWRLSRTPPRITRHAPLFGQDTHYVIGEVLGLGSDEIERLEADKVLW